MAVYSRDDFYLPFPPARADALALMHEYTASESLRKHMLAVEAAMRAYAEHFGEDPERWGLAGLIHDFDYERYPNAAHSATEEHPAQGVRTAPRARMAGGHSPGDSWATRRTANVPRETRMARSAVRGGRAHGFDHGDRARQADEERSRRGRAVRAKKDEGQSVREGREPRRRLARRAGAGRRSRSAHPVRDRRDAARRRTRSGWPGSGGRADAPAAGARRRALTINVSRTAVRY